jgi:N-methylhydantoinase A
MLMADSFKDYSLTTFLSGSKATPSAIEEGFKILEDRPRREFPGEQIKFERFLDARYRRQSHEITIPYRQDFVQMFHQAHRKAFGYLKPHSELEIVTLRVRATVKKGKLELPRLSRADQKVGSKKEKSFFGNKEIEIGSYRRDDFFAGFRFLGPALILESTSTLFIPPDFRCEVDEWGSIMARV